MERGLGSFLFFILRLLGKRVCVCVCSVLCLGLCLTGRVIAQETFPTNGMATPEPGHYAFVNAQIYLSPDQLLSNATLIVDAGRVQEIGASVVIPEGAQVIDLEGSYIYPSFIDIYLANYGLKKLKGKASPGYFISKNGEQLFPLREGLYGGNDAIRADFDAKNHIKNNSKQAAKLRAMGIGLGVSFLSNGIARGTGALITLAEAPIQACVLSPTAATYYSFDKGSSKQDYPVSSLGAAALLRQMRYDAAWYASSANTDQVNITLHSLWATRSLPQIIESPNVHFTLLANKIGQETDVSYIVKSKGEAYQRAQTLAKANTRIILPLNFPGAYEVSDPHDALNVSLKEMKHWEMAPAGAARLYQAGVPFVFTSQGIKKTKDFFNNLREAISHGLPKEEALRALTLRPAEWLNAEAEIGSLKEKRRANFFIASKDIFENKDAVIYEHWLLGKKHVLKDRKTPDLRGTYELKVGEKLLNLVIKGTIDKPVAEIKGLKKDTAKYKATLTHKEKRWLLQYHPIKAFDEVARLSGWRYGHDLSGRGKLGSGKWVSWQATYQGSVPKKEDDPKKEAEEAKEAETAKNTLKMLYPLGAYGFSSPPTENSYLIKGATVWTNEATGILPETDVLFVKGKITAVGKDLAAPPGTTIINAKGKHLSSGIIDEHSHIALFSVNEWSEAVSAQVRMSDVINPADPNIYRQLAGGVTAAQLLHGSANPIGGQSALVKFRWGRSADSMRIVGADKFIKFALGENVKRSNTPSAWVKRYPQTRMGVEQVFQDAFERARAYIAAQKAYEEGERDHPPRKDLQLEALAEIIESKRYITCHSYIQSEINMLMTLATLYGIRVNTFTHILEGYKVADKMFEHGAAASTFSDWWAYKYEVKEAIPYNAALMHKAGLVVAINSDDPEMGRRLNQEAAKTIKYGGLSEEEAWKTVTLNPARMLHLDDRMGSIRVGKDADLVIWNHNPLSVYAKAEKTFVDGVLYYDRSREKEILDEMNQERNRLVKAMLLARSKGKRVQKKNDKPSHAQTYSCHRAHEH